MSFAWNLKTLRNQTDLTQGELANKIGVSQKTLSSWETGRTEPNIGEVIELCKTLDCTLETITGIRMHDIGDVSFEDVLVKLNQLSYEQLEKVIALSKETITRKKELERMEAARKEQLAKIAEYEAEIERLKQQIKKNYPE